MKRAALFVGVNRYEDPMINRLEYAENDANELYGFFKHKGSYDEVRSLISPDSDLVLDTAHEMAESLSEGDLFLFFFAGHGTEYAGKHLLLFPKARLSRLEYQHHTIPLDLLKKETSINGLNRIIILDACRSGLQRGARSLDQGGMRDVRCIKEVTRTTREAEGALGILCSCDEGQQSTEIANCGQGIFSAALLKVLEDGLKAGKGIALSDELEKKLVIEMEAIAHKYSIPLNQRPWIQKSGILPEMLGNNRGSEIRIRDTDIDYYTKNTKHKEPETETTKALLESANVHSDKPENIEERTIRQNGIVQKENSTQHSTKKMDTFFPSWEGYLKRKQERKWLKTLSRGIKAGLAWIASIFAFTALFQAVNPQGDINSAYNFFMPGSILLTIYILIRINNRDRKSLRNKYLYECAEILLGEENYREGSRYALEMGKEGIDKLLASALIDKLAILAMEEKDRSTANALNEKRLEF